MPHILMKYLEEICIDIDSVQISGHWDRIVGSISHMQIAIVIFEATVCYISRYVVVVHREACRYRAINAVNSSIIITDSKSKCGTC